MAVVITGLVLSGLTAFALPTEVDLLARLLHVPEDAATTQPHGLRGWIATVRTGLQQTDDAYPWMAYGTDWLAFAHLAIALFFVSPMRHPQRDHRGVLNAGIVACVGIVPLAIIAGQVRAIPWGWRCIDCAFGLVCLVPLLWARRIHHRTLRTCDSA